MSIQQTVDLPISFQINPTIIGISGSNGSGKDTIGAVLEERFGFLFVSVTDLLREEAKNRGQEVEREVLRTISAEWRREGGLGVLIDKALDNFNSQEPGKFKGLAIASLRNPGENDKVHVLEGRVIWVDADSRVRYDRVTSAIREGREAEDNKTFEQFKAEEAAEMTSSGDEATLNMSAVKEKADFIIENNGSDIEAFKDEIESLIIEKMNLTKA